MKTKSELMAELAEVDAEPDEFGRARVKSKPRSLLSVVPAPTTEYGGGGLLAYLGDDDPGDSVDDWLIRGVLAAGVPQVLAGAPKSQKTFMAEDMAICIAAGIPWLDFQTKRGRVLLLPKEDSVRETRRRIWRLARGHGLDPRDLQDWLRIDTLTEFYWQNDAQVANLGQTILHWKPSLVVIDSLARTNQCDENSNAEMSIMLNRLTDISQNMETAIAVIHHFNKAAKGTLLQNLRGAGAIGATMRHIIGVDKPKKRGEAFEIASDGNLQGIADPFKIKMVDGMDTSGHKVIRFAKVTAKDTRGLELGSPLIGDLLGQFKIPGCRRTKRLLRQGHGKDEVDAAIAFLIDEGVLAEVHNGKLHCGYELAEVGKKLLFGDGAA